VWVGGQGAATGLLAVFCQHTSASLVIQENADTDVQRDLETFFENLVCEDLEISRHATEGSSALPAVQLSSPIAGGRMALVTW